jgi:multiple sugar transport system permease protein
MEKIKTKRFFKCYTQKTFIYGLLLIWLVISIFPFLWAVITSIKYPVDAFAIPPVWVFKPTLSAYQTLWIDGEFFHYLYNTLVISIGSVAISLIIGCPAGYALARYSKNSSFYLLLVAIVFRALPRTLFILPFYYIAKITGLFDTKILLILIMVSINQPFTIWMLRSFFKNIPESLEEAAMVDGCTRSQAFMRVIFPIMGPGVITAGIFTFILAYSEYFIPVVLTATRSVTMPVAIAQFGVDAVKEWAISAAGAVSISLPVVLIVIFAQKYIVEGLTAGAVKE